jgi:hypothetical protein
MLERHRLERDRPERRRTSLVVAGPGRVAALACAGLLAGLLVAGCAGGVTSDSGSTAASPSGTSTVRATATVLAGSDAGRILLLPAASGLAVLRGTEVVGWAASRGTSPVPLPLTSGTSRPAQVVPEALTLVACDGSGLAPGAYTVRAVVGYGGDPLNVGAAGVLGVFHLVSAPVPLTVT